VGSARELIESFGALLFSINLTSRAGGSRSCSADETSNGEVEEPLVDVVEYLQDDEAVFLILMK
jgi:hypothetical protein